MVKKIFFGVAIFMLAILFTNSVSAASIDIDYNAELSKVCKPSRCMVPIPTLVNPNEKIIKIDENFYLTGLTWNNTKIDIYLDDQYQGVATVVNDDNSDTANFYYLITNNSLLDGQHEWKVIAWTENMRQRSYVSAKNEFSIKSYFTAPHLDKITADIDGNNWLIGSTESNSVVNIYVDHIYQGQVRADGNFNYNIGNLSSGLHTFYALAQELDTNQTSKRSNILSKQVVEAPVILEEVMEDIEGIEEVEVLEENQISSISEEKDSVDDINVQNEGEEGSVSVTELENSDIELGIISQEESQEKLVVDNQKSELDNTEEVASIEEIKEITVSEELQPAIPNIKEKIIREELVLIEKQERNRKVGLFLLVILIVIVVASTFLSKKKENRKKDEKDNSHQGNLFNGK